MEQTKAKCKCKRIKDKAKKLFTWGRQSEEKSSKSNKSDDTGHTVGSTVLG